MSNAEQVAYQAMQRGCEESLFCSDVQDDEQEISGWRDAKSELPAAAEMCWVAVPNAILCRYQTLLCYMDSDDQWRDAGGVLMFRKVAFWQYANVPVCEGVC
jgi:hypothetical protein